MHKCKVLIRLIKEGSKGCVCVCVCVCSHILLLIFSVQSPRFKTCSKAVGL